MGLSPEEKSYIHESAREIAAVICKEVVENHIVNCPHGRAVDKTKWILIGLCAALMMTEGNALLSGVWKLLCG